MKKIISIFVVVAIIFVIGGCSDSPKLEELVNSDETIDQQTSQVENTVNVYEMMEYEIKSYLLKHNSVTKNYKSVTVRHDSSGIWFTISLQAYETYTFAAVVSAATDVVGELIEKYELEAYHLQIKSPEDAKNSISWISWTLDTGLLNDNTFNSKYDEYCSLDYVLKRYGYEDFEGELSDSISLTNTSQSSVSATVYIASSGNGKKYHRRKTCSGMNGNAVSISMEDAKAQGYSACKICY